LNVVVRLLFIATHQHCRRPRRDGGCDQALIGGPGIVYVLLFGVTSVAAQIFFDYSGT